jgi:hypothetical protein
VKVARAIAATLLLSLLPIAASAQTVTVVVHVPLHDNAGRPVPAALFARYERAFRRLGLVVDRPGIGSWMGGGAALSFEADDHVFIRTTPPRALAFLARFLPRMRADLHQQATLAELFDGWYGSAAQRRMRLDVVLPLTCLCSARIRAIHAAFAPAGGASQFDGLDGTHIWSSVTLPSVAARLAALRRLGVTAHVSRATFILSD